MGPNGFVFFLEIADLALLLPMLESTADDFATMVLWKMLMTLSC